MARLTEQETVNVEAVIASLCAAHLNPRAELRALIERAAKELDAETAEEWCAALIGHLTEQQADASVLEALLVLGLAYPEVFERHRISMPQEGRRLAVLLEKSGDVERAQSLLELLVERHPRDRSLASELSAVMRRSGSLGRLVERHLSRAEEAMRGGFRSEAIRWLREVLALEPNRRDVARMIRDLRFEQQQIRDAWKKWLKLSLGVAGGALLVAAAWWRESKIDSAYAALPAAAPGDVESQRVRLAELDGLIESSPLWLGLWSAGRERAELRSVVDRVDSLRAAETARLAQERARTLILAESERSRANEYAQQYEFDLALEHFSNSLSHAPQDWEHRAQVERDIAALVEWQRSGRRNPQGGSK